MLYILLALSNALLNHVHVAYMEIISYGQSHKWQYPYMQRYII